MTRLLLRICLGIFFWMQSVSGYSQCTPPTAQLDLDINNVRARILDSGDMWWDLSNSQYEIPKGSGKRSIFCGSVWIGGLDPIGNLHIACNTYRQSGNDFWPGPLDTANASTIDSACWAFDRVWKLDRSVIQSFIENRNDPNYVIPEEILSWPGNGNVSWGQAHQLAPYADINGNGVYEPTDGDYPAFNFTGQNSCEYDLLGDQAIWWVFNDKGNVHSESNGTPLGFEVHAMAFAYRSQEASLDNATFYRYTIINRSTVPYSQMFFSQWIDYDLGDAFDDFVGFDVARGLGYCYNGDANDGATAAPGPGTYGNHPPAIGVDFLRGPKAPIADGVDNDRDSVIDESGECYQMSYGLRFDKGFSVTGWPNTAQNKYDRMKCIYNDGSPMTYGGNGYGGTVICKFMFPGDSDPLGWATGGVPQSPWDEINSGNLPNDRRQMGSVGPFDMSPGQVEVITLGIPWARDTNGNNLDAIAALQAADDYIQTLFDNCFSIPCAAQPLPDISYTYENTLAYFSLLDNGTSWSWDFGDGQHSNQHYPSHYYTAPGTYTITVSVTNTCGVYSDTTTLFVHDYLQPCGPELTRIEGQGNGNCNLEFTKETIDALLASPDHRVLFPTYTAMHGPVKISYEDYHALQDGDYMIAFDSIGFNSNWKLWKVGTTDTVYSDTTIGSGEVQRISMWGLGVEMQQVKSPGYNNNPKNNGYLTSSISFANPSQNWLTGIPDTDGNVKENWIRSGTRVGAGTCIADFNDRYNGATPLDRDEYFENILGGTWGPYRVCSYNPSPNQATICYDLGPAWMPSPIAATVSNRIESISNVDVVITSDKSKWTRCCVIESGAQYLLNEGQREPWHLRDALSVDKNGLNINNGGISDPSNPDAADYIGANGMGWFPGYAINLETGERLNMAFAENSGFPQEHGRDMLWNPTENEFQPSGGGNLWGGCHYIYVFGHNGNAVYTSGVLNGELKDIPMYDAGEAMYKILNIDATSNPELREVYADAMWTTIPVINPGHNLMECDVTVKLRVQKPYATYQTDSIPQNRNYPLYGFRIDKNNLTCNAYEGDVAVFPNPFVDETVIRFENVHEHQAHLTLYDVQGRIVREYKSTSDRITISAAGMNSGMYVWTLELEGEKPRTGKLVLR